MQKVAIRLLYISQWTYKPNVRRLKKYLLIFGFQFVIIAYTIYLNLLDIIGNKHRV